MAIQITKVRCNKTLISPLLHQNQQNFTEGNTYEGKSTNILRNLTVRDDQNKPHTLGKWFKHFTIIPERHNFR